MSLQNRASLSEEDLLQPPHATSCSEGVKATVSERHDALEWPPESDSFSFESLDTLTAVKSVVCAACRESRPIRQMTLGYSGWICAQCVVECLELPLPISMPDCNSESPCSAPASEARKLAASEGAKSGSD